MHLAVLSDSFGKHLWHFLSEAEVTNLCVEVVINQNIAPAFHVIMATIHMLYSYLELTPSSHHEALVEMHCVTRQAPYKHL